MRLLFGVLALVAIFAVLSAPAPASADFLVDDTVEANELAPPVVAEEAPGLDSVDVADTAQSAPATRHVSHWLQPDGAHAATLMPAPGFVPTLTAIPNYESGDAVFRRNPELTTRADDVLPHPCGGWPGD